MWCHAWCDLHSTTSLLHRKPVAIHLSARPEWLFWWRAALVTLGWVKTISRGYYGVVRRSQTTFNKSTYHSSSHDLSLYVPSIFVTNKHSSLITSGHPLLYHCGIITSKNGWSVAMQWYAVLMLKYWGRDKRADFFQTTYSNLFSWMKMY